MKHCANCPYSPGCINDEDCEKAKAVYSAMVEKLKEDIDSHVLTVFAEETIPKDCK